MSEVWCVVSDDDREAREIAALLLSERNEVAVLTADAAPFALLVNEYGDAVLPAEIGDDDFSLHAAFWAIEANFGAVDMIAFVEHDHDEDRVRRATDFFHEHWPEAEVMAVAPARDAAGVGAWW